MTRVGIGLREAALLGVAAWLLAACGGHPQYTQEQHFDMVECSLAGWGATSMPRQACLDQGGIPL